MIITLKGADFSGAGNNIGNLSQIGGTFTFTINPTPSDAIVKINGTTQKSITGAYGTAISWEVSKDGYNTRTGSLTMPLGGKTMSVSLTAVGSVTPDPEEPGTGGGSGDNTGANAIVFNFNSSNENGVDLTKAGTVSGGKMTITTPTTIDYTGITLSADKDWTFECIALPSTSTGLIPIALESTKGGFIQLPNPKGADTACLRLRDENRTMSAEASWTTGYTEPTHFAVTYSASPRTLKMYMNYTELPVAYGTGSINTFNSFTPTKLFGGYNGTYNYCGDLYYMSFTEAALTPENFHRE